MAIIKRQSAHQAANGHPRPAATQAAAAPWTGTPVMGLPDFGIVTAVMGRPGSGAATDVMGSPDSGVAAAPVANASNPAPVPAI